ncbi:hypothetical protein XPU_2250 [Xanthomonas arboricola pv. pruni str. MAFF 311562]|uniref:Uncharacterized protein n=1 Tax=Xanthomonas arboricola pv. pruni str. MAFF 311562 TaxID=1414836 RepID=W4S3G8_9XANT|nr:hypothetical protein XPU_2250 [Xanthomonas arboricola pv. pruni str. MAFF 311562]GAE59434.1 hypothetical protein XPN_1340 [Xanthomonas arboricola pv. pruni MAFF 301427]
MRARDERLVAAIGRRHATTTFVAEAVASTVAAVAEAVTAVALLVLPLALALLILAAILGLVLTLTLTLTLTLRLGLSLVLTLAPVLRLILVLLLLRLIEALLLCLAALAGVAMGVAALVALVGAGGITGIGRAIAGRLRRCRIGSVRRGLRGTWSVGCGAGGQGQVGLLRATVVGGSGGLAHARLAHALLDRSVDAAPGIGGRMIGQVRDSSLRVRAPGWGANFR